MNSYGLVIKYKKSHHPNLYIKVGNTVCLVGGSVGDVQFKTYFFKKNFTTPFYGWGSTFSKLHYEETVYFLTLGPWDFLLHIKLTSERRMAVLTLEPLNGFEPKTPGLGIQHLNRWATTHLDLPISFLYMSNYCSILVIHS